MDKSPFLTGAIVGGLAGGAVSALLMRSILASPAALATSSSTSDRGASTSKSEQQPRQSKPPQMRSRSAIDSRQSALGCTEGPRAMSGWRDGSPSLQYELLSCPQYAQMAGEMCRRYPRRFRFHATQYGKFPDQTDNIVIGGFADKPAGGLAGPDTTVNNIMGRHVLYLACFSSNDEIMQQLHVLIVLLQSFIKTLTIVLPFYPQGTMERVVHEGEVATANTMAHILSNLPNCGKPTRIVIYDIHTLQNRFFFSHHLVASTVTTVPLCLRIMKQGGFTAVAFPDDGATKRFSGFFHEAGFHIVVCNKTRRGQERVVEIARGNPRGHTIMILDDLVRSGGTLANCSQALRGAGAKGVSAFVPHAVFPQDTFKRFSPRCGAELGAAFDTFYVTNSIPHVVSRIAEYERSLHDADRVFEIVDLVPQIVADLTRGSRSGTDIEALPVPEGFVRGAIGSSWPGEAKQ